MQAQETVQSLAPAKAGRGLHEWWARGGPGALPLVLLFSPPRHAPEAPDLKRMGNEAGEGGPYIPKRRSFVLS